MRDWNNKRPGIVENVSALGIGKAIYAAPDGNKETARLLIAADGFHFKPTDFDDLVLPGLSFESTKGTKYDLSFDDDGALLINGVKYTLPTNQGNETIDGSKTFSSTINGNLNGNSTTATKLATARTIGGVSFDGTQDIDLAGVNKIGNQDTTGKAATADMLNTRPATFNDFADVAKNMNQYAGNWVVSNKTILNSPISGLYYMVYVFKGSDSNNNGYIIVTTFDDTVKQYITVINNSVISGWHLIANDNDVLHNIGNETADGIKTFIKQIIAQSGVKGNLQGNADTATKFNATHKIGGVVFDGGTDINLPGVNLKGTQDTSGKAATAGVADSAAQADKLTTGAKINGTNFDGTTDIQVHASNDGQLVHTSGVETVGGVKTFTDVVNAKSGLVGNITGNVSGTSSKLATARKIAGIPFDGSYDIDLAGVNKTGNQDTTGNAATADVLNMRKETFTDISVVTADMVTYSGNWTVNSSNVNGIPSIGYVVMEVLPSSGNKTAGIIRISSTSGGIIANYIGLVRNGSNLTWVELADNSNLVHNSGNEMINGNKTYEGKTKLSGGLQLTSPNGTVFNIAVDDDGKLTTEKEVSNA